MRSTEVLDTAGNLLGFASTNTRTARLHLVTPNGLDLVRDAGDLDEARQALEDHRTWVASR